MSPASVQREATPERPLRSWASSESVNQLNAADFLQLTRSIHHIKRARPGQLSPAAVGNRSGVPRALRVTCIMLHMRLSAPSYYALRAVIELPASAGCVDRVARQRTRDTRGSYARAHRLRQPASECQEAGGQSGRLDLFFYRLTIARERQAWPTPAPCW